MEDVTVFSVLESDFDGAVVLGLSLLSQLEVNVLLVRLVLDGNAVMIMVALFIEFVDGLMGSSILRQRQA